MDATRAVAGVEPITRTIGRYRLVRPCPIHPDEGPAYVAFDPVRNEQVVVQLVAVPADQPMGPVLLRLKGDVETSGRLGHPGLVPARALGIDEQRGPYLVRGFVDGPSLRALPKMEADLHAALRILVQAAHALTVADEAGVAPRTLRLESIFVSPNGQVRLQAFGLPHADAPSAASSAYQLARAGLKLIVGALDQAEVSDGDAPPRLPAALDKGLARAFRKALEADPAERFPTPVAFAQVLIAEAPLQEARLQELLELIDQRTPVLEDPVVADWVRRMWRERKPEAPVALAPVLTLAPNPAATPARPPAPAPVQAVVQAVATAPAPVKASAIVPALAPPAAALARKRRGPVLLVAGAVLVALAVGGFAAFGGRTPATMRVEPTPPGGTREVDGRTAGATPAEPKPPAAPSGPEASAAATVPAQKPAPEAKARPEPVRQAVKPAAPARPAGKAAEKERRRFDLYKHLEKQSRGQ